MDRRLLPAALLLTMLSIAPNAHAVSSGGDILYSAITRTQAGDEGIRATLRIPGTVDTSSTAYLRGYVRAQNASNVGSAWITVGWSEGKCGGSTTTSPRVFVAYRHMGSTTCELFTSHFLSSGASYEFRVQNSTGNEWKAYFVDGTGTTHLLKTVTLSWSASSNYSAAAVEHFAPVNDTVPELTSDANFSNMKLLDGTWVPWDQSYPVTVGQMPLLVGLEYVALQAKYHYFRVSPTPPDFTVTGPATVSAPVGFTTSVLIQVTAGKTYTSDPSLNGPIKLRVNAAPIGVLALWEEAEDEIAAGETDKETIDTVLLTPLANQTFSTVLKLTTFAPSVNPGVLVVGAVGDGISKTATISVDTLP